MRTYDISVKIDKRTLNPVDVINKGLAKFYKCFPDYQWTIINTKETTLEPMCVGYPSCDKEFRSFLITVLADTNDNLKNKELSEASYSLSAILVN